MRLPLRGLHAFFAIWAGHTLASVGDGLRDFALGLWVLRRTASVTRFGMVSAFRTVPYLLAAPFAGAMVDRWDRRRTLLGSVALPAMIVLVAAFAAAENRLSMSLVFTVVVVAGLAEAFHWPGFGAAVTLLVPREQLGRANGLVQLALALGQSGGPVLAALLLGLMHISHLLFIDVAALCAALATIAVARIGDHEVRDGGGDGRLAGDLALGWRFVFARRGLLGLLLLLAATNFVAGMVVVLTPPLVLSFSTQRALGAVLASGGAGMVCGSLLMSAWGGPRRRVLGVLGGLALGGLVLVAGGTRSSSLLLGTAAFLFLGSVPIVAGCSQAIWQVKVPVAMQGRVFAVRGMIALGTTPLGHVAAGPLADKLFEPAFREGGALAGSVGRLFGVGPGRGIGFLLSLAGLSTLLVVAVAWLQPRVRLVEEQLPDAPMASAAGDESREEGAMAS